MSAGKCNLLLIKTCCWLWLQTDNNSKLSAAQFSPSPLSSYFPQSLHLWPHLSLLSPLLVSLPAPQTTLLTLFLHLHFFPSFPVNPIPALRFGAWRRVARSSWMRSIATKWDAPSGTSYIIDSLRY